MMSLTLKSKKLLEASSNDCFSRAWPHLQVVYELLLRFIMSNEIESNVIRSLLDDTFMLKLLDLFNSEDPRERDYLKTLLHRIYGKFMPMRPFVRESIMNFFLKIAYAYEESNGISELLEILCTTTKKGMSFKTLSFFPCRLNHQRFCCPA